MIRLIICVDVETDNLIDAYRQVYRQMTPRDHTSLEWRSTDDWYGPDGVKGSPDELIAARMAVVGELRVNSKIRC